MGPASERPCGTNQMSTKSGLTIFGWVGLAIFVVVLIFLALHTGCTLPTITPPPSVVTIGTSGSMEPLWHGGEIRTVEKIPFKDLRSGMIALVYFGGAWHPHQLGFCRKGRWQTQGINNSFGDTQSMTEREYGGVLKP